MSSDQTDPQRPQPNDEEPHDGTPAFEDGDDEPDFADEHDTLTVGDDPIDEPAEPDVPL